MVAVQKSVSHIEELLVVCSTVFDEIGVIGTFSLGNKIVNLISLSAELLAIYLKPPILTPSPLVSSSLFLCSRYFRVVPWTVTVRYSEGSNIPKVRYYETSSIRK